MSAKKWTKREAEASLWMSFEEFVLSFTDHTRIHLLGVRSERVWDKFKDHYTRDGRIDMDQFLKDFTTLGPIASRIVELQLERTLLLTASICCHTNQMEIGAPTETQAAAPASL